MRSRPPYLPAILLTLLGSLVGVEARAFTIETVMRVDTPQSQYARRRLLETFAMPAVAQSLSGARVVLELAIDPKVGPEAFSIRSKNRRVTIENISSQSIYYLYASPQTSSDWEEDLLGSGTIPAGANKSADLDNGTNECIYDLKARLADGTEYIQWKINVCAVSTWTIGDTGNTLR